MTRIPPRLLSRAIVGQSIALAEAFAAAAVDEAPRTGLVHRVLRGRTIAELTEEERQVLQDSVAEVWDVPGRQVVVERDALVNVSTLLVNGLMSRIVDDRDGVRQQVAVHFPGDFVDLHAYPLKRLDHSVVTMTSARLALVPHARLEQIQADYPELTRKLWFMTLLDASMHRKWVFRLGRLSAVQRIGHFLCETNLRLRAIGLSDGRSFSLQLTQFDLGEICGLTSVHVNRVLRELRDAGLASFRTGTVQIHDPAGLAELAHFDSAYLYLKPQPVAGDTGQ